MKPLAKTSVKILATLLVMAITVYSVKSQSNAAILKTGTDTVKAELRMPLLPARIAVNGDSIALVVFMQTAIPYVFKIKSAEDIKKLEILKSARKNCALVYIRSAKTSHNEIIDVEYAPKELTLAFQRYLHISPRKLDYRMPFDKLWFLKN